MSPCRNCTTPTNGEYCPACEFITPAEARERLHISQATWYLWIKKGRLTPRKVGPRKHLIPRVDVEALLA